MELTGLSELKQRIQAHYDVCSTYYHSLWGEHVHHGYWTPETNDISKEEAQLALIRLLLRTGSIDHAPASGDPTRRLRVLDVGCGLGGTSRYLAKEMGCEVTGVTISTEQVKMARTLSVRAAKEGGDRSGRASKFDDAAPPGPTSDEFIPLGTGSVRFLALDAENIASAFPSASFDLVWICEALSHLPAKPKFFSSAAQLLVPGGTLVVADWFRAPQASEDEIRPIEEGMLLPPLGTMAEYSKWAEEAGLQAASDAREVQTVVNGSAESGEENWKDVSKEVARTWDISLDLVASPSLWAFAFSQGRDFVAFLKAFQAMRSGFASGSFRYGVAAFRKGEEE